MWFRWATPAAMVWKVDGVIVFMICSIKGGIAASVCSWSLNPRFSRAWSSETSSSVAAGFNYRTTIFLQNNISTWIYCMFFPPKRSYFLSYQSPPPCQITSVRLRGCSRSGFGRIILCSWAAVGLGDLQLRSALHKLGAIMKHFGVRGFAVLPENINDGTTQRSVKTQHGKLILASKKHLISCLS